MIRVFDIIPTPAPRQTQRDRFNPSEAVLRYRAFRDEVGLKIKVKPSSDFFHVVFLLPMPASWSHKKKRNHVGQPHFVKPDKDNLEKAFIDALYRDRDDAHVWNTASTKLWAYDGAILVSDQWLHIAPFGGLGPGFLGLYIEALEAPADRAPPVATVHPIRHPRESGP